MSLKLDRPPQVPPRPRRWPRAHGVAAKLLAAVGILVAVLGTLEYIRPAVPDCSEWCGLGVYVGTIAWLLAVSLFGLAVGVAAHWRPVLMLAVPFCILLALYAALIAQELFRTDPGLGALTWVAVAVVLGGAAGLMIAGVRRTDPA